MSMLDVLIDFYLKKRSSEDFTSEEEALLRHALKNEVLSDVKKHYRKQLKEAEKKERLRLKRQRLAAFILEALILALLVGLLVNQITNIVTQIQIGLDLDALEVSTVLIALLTAFITWFILAQLGVKFISKEDS